MGVLRANYRRGFHRVENRGGWKAFTALPARRRSTVRCLTGHMPFGMHKAIPGPYQYATMLRCPTDRVLSLYYYIKSRPGHTRYKLAQRCDVLEFVRCRRISDTDNGLIRFLAGRDDVGIRPPVRSVTIDDLDRAKENLATFAAVGFMERFDASLARFAGVFGWTRTEYKSMLVNRRNRPDLKGRWPEVLEGITAHNTLDWELYRWAIDRWGSAIGIG